jgi:hypothetical protein
MGRERLKFYLSLGLIEGSLDGLIIDAFLAPGFDVLRVFEIGLCTDLDTYFFHRVFKRKVLEVMEGIVVHEYPNRPLGRDPFP